MARNRIEELLVQLKFEGSEELRKVASGFRDLGRATTLTDAQIQSARRQINDYAKSLNNSEQALRGQIQALQTLRTQATVGGNVYSQLANDVTRLSKTLKGLEEDYKAVGRAAEQTDRQIANQFPARRPEAFRVQMAALRRELDGISVSARAYGNALTEITIRQTAFGRAQARQGVIAGAQAVGAPLIGSMTPQQELPNTTAALRLRLTELRDDLQNTDYALNDYKNTLKEVEVVQKELDRVTGDANKTRKEEIRDRIANLKAINEENAALRQQRAAAGSIARNRAGQAATAGRGLSGAMFGPQAPSEMFRSIGAIIDQPALNTAQLMGRTYGDVAQQIRSVAASSDGSINSLQRQRAAWQQLRTTISPLSADYGKVAKEADRAMAAIDRQTQRMQGRRRLGAMEATQAAGAVISGGIFGGPEGAIGGAVGTAIGGVPGAFAGAAIGAQVGMIRQSLGEMASFTAEIDKQRIALRNVVGSQSEYQSSLQFIDATSRRLAIPQDQLNKQFTQLSASVIGAGGNVDAAKVAFEGIAAGIRGTGGSLGGMEAALLATAQVFSKGKVSAEELRQQIGERLPGAFTIFAQSMGKTPQELDKMLEKGEVGLNDFMTFVQALSQRYGASANEIAASSQSAGDRMATTFARIREAVGRELQPVGAQFQATFADLFEEAEPTLVNFARGISAALTSFGAVASSFVTATKPIRDFIQFYSVAFPAFWRSIGDDVETLIGRIRSLFEGVFSFWQNIWNSLRAASTSALKSIGIDADFLARQFGQIIGWLQNAWSTAFTFIQVRWRQTVQNMINYSNPLAAVLKGFGIDVGKAVTSGMFAGMATGQGGGVKPVAPLRPVVPSTFPGGGASGAGTGGGGAKPAQAPENRTGDLRDQLKLLTAMSEVEDMIRDLRFQGRDALAIEAEQYKQMIQIEYDRAQALKQTNYESERGIVNETARQKLVDLDKKTQDELRALAAQRSQEELRVKQAVQSAVEPFRSLRVQQELQAQYSKTYYRLLTEGMLPAEAERIAGFEKMVAEQRGALDLQIQTTEAALQEALARTEGAAAAAELRKELKKLRAQRGAVDGVAAEGPSEGPSQADRARQAIANVRAELNSLVDPVNQVVSAATAIGDAFGNSFKGVITGSMTAREALASFFSSVADSFADMAAKMSAEWIKLAILNTIVKIFSGGSGMQGAASAEAYSVGTGASIFAAANGSAFAQNGIVPYAKGGIVNRPTMFKFARGGAMSTGVMGEAGPEAIMPLKRGADGKLGVAAAGGSGVTVNVSVDAKGTQVQGDPGQGAQLGRVIAGAVQQELIKQQRPGGLLAGAR